MHDNLIYFQEVCMFILKEPLSLYVISKTSKLSKRGHSSLSLSNLPFLHSCSLNHVHAKYRERNTIPIPLLKQMINPYSKLTRTRRVPCLLNKIL